MTDADLNKLADSLGAPPVHYHICINETQRQVIEEALMRLAPICLNPEGQEELPMLLECVRDLPSEEKRQPGALHGLAL